MQQLQMQLEVPAWQGQLVSSGELDVEAKLYVSNLDYGVSNEDIKVVFSFLFSIVCLLLSMLLYLYSCITGNIAGNFNCLLNVLCFLLLSFLRNVILEQGTVGSLLSEVCLLVKIQMVLQNEEYGS